MADKRIRISADVSSLRQIREEVSNLSGEFNRLNESASSALNFDQSGYDATIQGLREEITLLGERNEVTNRPLQPVPSRPAPPQQKTATEEVRETTTPRQTEVEKTRESADTVSRAFTTPELQDQIRRNSEDIQELRQIRKTVDKDEDSEYYQNLTNEINRLLQANIEHSNVIRDQEARGYEPDQNTGSQAGVRSGSTRTENTNAILRQILQTLSTISTINEETNRLLGSEEAGNRGQTGNVPLPVVVPPVTPALATEGRQPAPRTERETTQRPSRLAQLGTGTTSILVQGAVESLDRVANARNAYESGAGVTGALGQAGGALIGSVGNAFGPVGGAIGGVLGGAVSGLSSVISSYMMRAIGKLEDFENNARLYTQTTGSTMREAQQVGFGEGGFAARDLGMNAGEYLNRRAEIIRSSGGRILGATPDDPTGTREANSLMAVQRGYGISEQVIDRAAGNLRFTTQGERQEGDSSTSLSGIIRLFDNTLRDEGRSFAEIASTIEESLNTFNRTVERTLDKAGEVDAGKIATILSSIREGTGMQGRQLERVQEAVTGQNVSQDPVTQALLMRVAREVSPEATTYPELMSVIEQMSSNSELQRAFLERLQDMAGPGNTTQLQGLLKAVFPGLSWTDVTDWTKSGYDPEKIISKTGVAPETAVGNEANAQYSSDFARNTVGAVEAATKEKDNRDAAQGAQMLQYVERIDNNMHDIIEKTNLIQIYAGTMASLMEIIKNGVTTGETAYEKVMDPKQSQAYVQGLSMAAPMATQAYVLTALKKLLGI